MVMRALTLAATMLVVAAPAQVANGVEHGAARRRAAEGCEARAALLHQHFPSTGRVRDLRELQHRRVGGRVVVVAQPSRHCH